MLPEAARSAGWPRTGDGFTRRRGEPRTRRHESTILGLFVFGDSGVCDRDERFDSGQPLQHRIGGPALNWVQLVLATPVVLWGGWPFFERAWQSIVNRSLNMFTLIGLGVAVAYVFSVIAVIAPQLFPPSFRGHGARCRFTLKPLR